MLTGTREGAVDYEQQAGPRLMFLTAIQDSAQNTVQIHYDTNIINGIRIDMVTDAVGQQTHLYYDLPTADEPLLAFRITRVIDPFQRTAYFDYDKNSNLRKITDVIGISSVFTYAPGSFINEMVTPYGLTAFSYADLDALGRSLTITDPNGDREYIIYQ